MRRYRRNWIVLHTTTFLMFTSYTIVLPTQHQFVTNPRHPEDPDVRTYTSSLGREGLYLGVAYVHVCSSSIQPLLKSEIINIAHHKGYHSNAFCASTIVCVQKCIDNARGYYSNSLCATICDRSQNRFSALTIKFCQNFILTLNLLCLFYYISI